MTEKNTTPNIADIKFRTPTKVEKLFKQFLPTSKKEWLEKVKNDLKGKSLEALDWQINEAIKVSPFAHSDDFKEKYAPISSQCSSNTWEIGVKVKVANWKLANQEALNALSNGANAICFELNENPTKTELQALLKGIQLEWISIHFIFKQKPWKRFTSFFLDYIQKNQLDINKIACTFSFSQNILSTKKEANQVSKIAQQLPKAQLLTVNARSQTCSNENIIDELAHTLFLGNDYLKQLNSNGLSVANFYSKIQFSITLGDSYFFNIAKIRALKLGWQQVLSAWNIQQNSIPNIEVHLTTITQTKDENYNKIKSTAQAMAAVIGGANRLYIYPSDEFKDDLGTSFAQRIALNIQHLLQLESYMDRVIDPAAGSYYIENLTDILTENAWERFRDLCS